MRVKRLFLLSAIFVGHLVSTAHTNEQAKIEIYRCEFACPYEKGVVCYNYIFRNSEGQFEDEHLVYEVRENDDDLLLTNIIWPSTEWDLPEAIGAVIIHIEKPSMANGNRYLYRRYCAGELCEPDLVGVCEYGQTY